MVTVVATEEAGITRWPTVRLNRAPFRGGGSEAIQWLLVRECIPAMVSAHEAPLRMAYINVTNEALALPWIEKLPGQKRIRFVHGQIFVIQHYLGMKVIRAHICRAQERCASPSGQNQGRSEVIVPGIPFENNNGVMVVHA